MSLRINGVDVTLRAMRQVVEGHAQRIEDSIVSCANVVLRKSQKLVPVDTGALKSSGHVETNGKKGFAAEASVEYGGPTAPYAFVVHEDTLIPHDPPTTSKYLSKAVTATRGTCTAILKRQMMASQPLGILSSDLDVSDQGG